MRKIIFLFALVILFGLSLILFKSSNNISYTSYIKGEGEEEEESPIKKKQTAIEREEYFFSILRDPRTNSIPENIREKEIAFASKLPKSEERLAKGLNALAFNWNEAGPVDVGGRTRAIVVDAANNNVIIAGGVSGGIWKSTDKGVTWLFKSNTSSILSVTSIVQDTILGSRNNWYAVGGEFDGNSARSRGGGASFYGGGFYRSTDNGENWNLVATNLTAPNGTSWNSMFSYASKVIVSPTSGYIFVGSNAGFILKSTDRGSSWTTNWGSLNDHYYADIIVNKNGVMVSYLSQLGSSGTIPTPPSPPPGLFKSTDEGSTWTNITPVDFPDTCSRSVMAFGTSNPNLIYVLTNTGNKIGSTKKDDVRLFKINISTIVSTDLTTNLPDLDDNGAGYIDTQGDYNMAIAVHPTDENIVFIAGTSLFRSLDGFATKPTIQKLNWIGGYGGSGREFFYPHLHPDIHTIVFDQNDPNGIWVGHDGGISYAPDATVTNYSTYFPWVDRDNLYNVTQYYTMAISQTLGDTRIFGGTQDNGSPFFRWTGTNATSSSDVTTGDGSYAYIGSQNLNGKVYTYGSTQNGSVVRFETSPNGEINGGYWSEVTPVGATGMKFINPFAVDPSDENYMYYIAGNVLWRNNSLQLIPNYQNKTSQGWSSIDLQIGAGYSFSTLAASRTPANILYLAASSTAGQPKIYKMSNSKTDTTKTDVTSNLNASNGSYIHGIAINPDNADEVLAVISNYGVKSLWYTTNGGSSWSDVEGNFTEASVRSATILPTSGSSKVYLIATSVGVYSASQMNGTSTIWTQEASTVMGKVVVEYITSRKSDGTVVAATHGRGAFVGKYTTTGIENENNLPTSFQLEQNYPNPFNPTTVISYQLPAASELKLHVYDVLGKLVATLVNGKVEAGNHKIEFNASKLASGIYIYRLESKDFVSAKKMILMK